MGRDQKRRQKALARKAAKRKARRKALAGGTGEQDGPSLSKASEWPLLECLISANWRDTLSLCQTFPSRNRF